MAGGRLLVTGAAGIIGGQIREGLRGLGWKIRLSDIVEMGEAGPGEEIVTCDLTDAEAVRALVTGCDAILHFGGDFNGEPRRPHPSREYRGNLSPLRGGAEGRRGARALRQFEPRHRLSFPRDRLTASSPIRPDSNYGVSKAYGEALARLYWDKYGIETLIVRIGSCFPAPKDRRMMATWISAGDMLRLIGVMLDVPRLGCPVVYGVSANDECWWDNSETAYLGWVPKDSSAQFAHLFEGQPLPDPSAPEVVWQGGGFAAAGHFED